MAKKITALLRLAERSPDSVALAARLRELEDEQRALDEQIANAEQAAGLRRTLEATTPAQAREILAAWMERDGTSLEQEREALSRMIDRIAFDPATGEGRIHYRIAAPAGAGRFRVGSGEHGASPRGSELNSGLEIMSAGRLPARAPRVCVPA